MGGSVSSATDYAYSDAAGKRFQVQMVEKIVKKNAYQMRFPIHQ